jgi:hypothetical protein
MPGQKMVTIEDAQLLFRNFAGREGQYNSEGDRNFCVILPPDLAKELDRDGWNVRALPAREEGEEDVPYLQVKVNFKNRPPHIVTISSVGRTNISEEMTETLDFADMRKVDLICNGYEWDVNGKSGVKAYLKSMFITLEEDELERKYAQMEDVDG